MRQLEIGNVRLKNNLILGPMAGVTDLPFRLLCAEQGAGLVCMEMVSAKGILYNNKNTEALLTIDEKEHPVALQFLVQIRILWQKWRKRSRIVRLIFWISIWVVLYQR